MRPKRGALQIILALLFLLVIGGASVYLYISTNKGTKAPATKQLEAQPTAQADTPVAPQTEYNNPFDKNTQYQNPFVQHANPFDSI